MPSFKACYNVRQDGNQMAPRRLLGFAPLLHLVNEPIENGGNFEKSTYRLKDSFQHPGFLLVYVK
jgi:hypothetical protein